MLQSSDTGVIIKAQKDPAPVKARDLCIRDCYDQPIFKEVTIFFRASTISSRLSSSM